MPIPIKDYWMHKILIIVLTTGGVQTYIGHYNQRINKYMPDVLLSEFNILVLEKFLLAAHKAGQPYKTLRRQVRDIRTFLRRMNVERQKTIVLKF